MRRDRLHLDDPLLNEAWNELQDVLADEPVSERLNEAIDRIESILLASQVKLLGEIPE